MNKYQHRINKTSTNPVFSQEGVSFKSGINEREMFSILLWREKLIKQIDFLRKLLKNF